MQKNMLWKENEKYIVAISYQTLLTSQCAQWNKDLIQNVKTHCVKYLTLTTQIFKLLEAFDLKNINMHTYFYDISNKRKLLFSTPKKNV